MSGFLSGRRLRLYMAITLCGVLIFGAWPSNAHALELTGRGLTMSSSLPGATTMHQFSFQYASTSAVGSVLFEYCMSPVDGVVCVPPPGLDASNASLQQQSGEIGFSVLSTNQNQIVLTRPPAATGQTVSSYTFDNIVNPNFNSCTMVVVPNCTFYARIYTYATTDASGLNTDFGGIAASTNPTISINTVVPPILYFCVGQTITGNDCTTATGDVVNLGVLNPDTAASGSSQMVAATNGQFGLSVAADGTTMTSGNNVIPGLSIPTVSAPGNSQFGINLRANSNPQVGQEPNGPGAANPAGPYNIPNEFTFNPGDVVATSPAVTDFRKFTVSYVTNISPGQAPGDYASTITYICTASF